MKKTLKVSLTVVAAIVLIVALHKPLGVLFIKAGESLFWGHNLKLGRVIVLAGQSLYWFKNFMGVKN